ncbi:MAG: 16S rRNA (guanine(527)-N(7))-methyltransferase RsmG [Lentisphaerae bacterium]|nr:16S rRNA (guanine(527)-N(7))-methyltransferase RsmG [Lentisphaerota bacterium]
MDIIAKYFAELSEQQLGQFRALDAVYREWNARINVISRKDIDFLYEKHVLHSLAIAAVAPFAAGARVVDVGTGGGFPGIPLAIACPEVQFWLVESIAKKITVVKAVIEALGLKNVTPVHGRMEALRGHVFDCAVARAVAPLGELWAWTRPVLRPGVQEEDFANGLICLKGGDLKAEIAESGLEPELVSVESLFPEPCFTEKYVVYVAR